MSLSGFFKQREIGGKRIYIVDDHHKALAAWALVRRSSKQAPNLITIDHHTDTIEAFHGYAAGEVYEGRAADEEPITSELVSKLDWRNDQSVASAIENLRHDEHIDAATRSGTLCNAFCIQLSDSEATVSIEEVAYDREREKSWPKAPEMPRPVPPLTYAIAANRIYGLPFHCFIGCQTTPHNDECFVRQSNEIVEARYLEDQLARGAEIARCIGLEGIDAAPYILDIDLDAFHTRKAITPDDASTFHRLIRNAVAITVATESECVEEEWLDDDDVMTSGDLLRDLLAHICAALKKSAPEPADEPPVPRPRI